jgi:hypothetical protein
MSNRSIRKKAQPLYRRGDVVLLHLRYLRFFSLSLRNFAPFAVKK